MDLDSNSVHKHTNFSLFRYTNNPFLINHANTSTLFSLSMTDFDVQTFFMLAVALLLVFVVDYTDMLKQIKV